MYRLRTGKLGSSLVQEPHSISHTSTLNMRRAVVCGGPFKFCISFLCLSPTFSAIFTCVCVCSAWGGAQLEQSLTMLAYGSLFSPAGSDSTSKRRKCKKCRAGSSGLPSSTSVHAVIWQRRGCGAPLHDLRRPAGEPFPSRQAARAAAAAVARGASLSEYFACAVLSPLHRAVRALFVGARRSAA